MCHLKLMKKCSKNFYLKLITIHRMFKMSPAVQKDINLLHASVLSMVEFDEDIFAGGHCFDENQYPLKKGLFCPFAHRLPAPEVSLLFEEIKRAGKFIIEWFSFTDCNISKGFSQRVPLPRQYEWMVLSGEKKCRESYS